MSETKTTPINETKAEAEQKGKEKEKKGGRGCGVAMLVFLGILVALLIGLIICAVTAFAEADKSRYEISSDGTLIDLENMSGLMLGEKSTIGTAAINGMLSGYFPKELNGGVKIISGQIATDEQQEGGLWLCAEVELESHKIGITVYGIAEAVKENDVVTAGRFTPEQVIIGKLSIPKFVWEPILNTVAKDIQLPYADGKIEMELPDVLGIDLNELRVTPEGIEVKAGQITEMLPSVGDVDMGKVVGGLAQLEEDLGQKVAGLMNEVLTGKKPAELALIELKNELSEEEKKELFDVLAPIIDKTGQAENMEDLFEEMGDIPDLEGGQHLIFGENGELIVDGLGGFGDLDISVGEDGTIIIGGSFNPGNDDTSSNESGTIGNIIQIPIG